MAKNPGPIAPVEAVDWKANTISPVANPMFFEDPVIRTEIRPIFAYHRIDDGFVTNGGHATLYALQIRYAITDRLAFIATQDGYFSINTGLGVDWEGWMDLAAGFKYALIDDQANQFILTPGFTYSIPMGSNEVFQGNGDGDLDLFVSAEKGFGDAHVMANAGFRIPLDSAFSTMFHYSAMIDYHVCQWFIPFVVANGWTVVSEGSTIGLDSEGYDVINFGSSAAGGTTQMTLGGGFRTRLTDNLDFGIAYEKAILSPEGLTDDRFTFDLSIRF
ncbi:MAG: hypothetical protein KDK97_06050 [Verrucomicrobiales bacterium]|nr:hypothetical protein [Verrucomicrobiales bacterium]